MFYIVLLIIFLLLILILITIHYNNAITNKTKLLLNPSFCLINTKIIRFILSLFNLNSYIMSYLAKQKKQLLIKQNQNYTLKNGICFYGDSMFTFWEHLKGNINNKLNIFNSSFGGSTSYDLLNNIYSLCINFKPSIVFIHTGGNDFDINIFYTNAQLIKNILNNIISIITICNKYNIKVIILLTPPSPEFSIKKRQFQIKLYDMIRKLSNCYILDVIKNLLDKFKQNNNVYKFDNIHLNY